MYGQLNRIRSEKKQAHELEQEVRRLLREILGDPAKRGALLEMLKSEDPGLIEELKENQS